MDLVSSLEKIPLDGDDLESMATCLGVDAKSLLYSDLKGKTLSSLFTHDNIYVLYDIRSDPSVVGHWVCLMKRGDDLYYYDPYGMSISQDLEVTNEPDYFSLFKGVDINVNPHRHQEFKEEVNTCGRHCVSRSMWGTNQEYNKLVTSISEVKNVDTYVSILTAFLDESDRSKLMLTPGGSSHFSGDTGGSVSSHFSF